MQLAAVPAAFCARYPGAKVDWLVREDLKGLLGPNPHIDKVISFPRNGGLRGLVGLAHDLASKGRYTHVYDAHNNVRSTIVATVFKAQRLFRLAHERWPQIITRPKNRVRRFLFFKMHWRRALRMPFRAIQSFHEPLLSWGIAQEPLAGPQFFISETGRAEFQECWPETRPETQPKEQPEKHPLFDVALVPSASWNLKRWPVPYWKRLIALLPNCRFVILGGPDDKFCEEIKAVATDRVCNLAGCLSLQGSAAALEHSRVVVTGDTGLLQIADQLGRPTVALIGPSAFGYPTRQTSQVLEIQLACKPCSKDGSGRCHNKVLQKCLIEITPEQVADAVRQKLELYQPQETLPATIQTTLQTHGHATTPTTLQTTVKG